MKYSELYKKLRKAGCFLLHHGAKHDLWENSHNGKRTRVPRHGTQEVPKGTLKTIYQELGLKAQVPNHEQVSIVKATLLNII